MARLRRPCKDCEIYFTPTGKFQKLCPVCKSKPEHLRGGLAVKYENGIKKISSIPNVNYG